MVAYVCNTELGRRRQEDQEFKTSLSYIVISKPVRGTWDSVLKHGHRNRTGKRRRKTEETEGERGRENKRVYRNTNRFKKHWLHHILI